MLSTPHLPARLLPATLRPTLPPHPQPFSKSSSAPTPIHLSEPRPTLSTRFYQSKPHRLRALHSALLSSPSRGWPAYPAPPPQGIPRSQTVIEPDDHTPSMDTPPPSHSCTQGIHRLVAMRNTPNATRHQTAKTHSPSRRTPNCIVGRRTLKSKLIRLRRCWLL